MMPDLRDPSYIFTGVKTPNLLGSIPLTVSDWPGFSWAPVC